MVSAMPGRAKPFSPGHDPAAIRSAALALAAAGGLRVREIAGRLAISEAQLIAAHVGACEGRRAVRLIDDHARILRSVPRLGPVMALTRNEAAVHEKVGTYGEPQFSGSVGGVYEREIDLRLFMAAWASAFAVEEPAADGALRRSLQFFDAHGTAIHKIHARPDTRHGVYAELVAAFTARQQEPRLDVSPCSPSTPDRPDGQIDAAALRAGWQAMGDVHEFRSLLNDYRVGRQQAFRLVGTDLAWPVARDAIRTATEQASADGVPVMIFVPNRGCIQIHTGPLHQVKALGPWWNVLDGSFNLHLRQDLVAGAWVVRKPTRETVITSLELFDADGGLILMMFGERHDHGPENPAWRALAEALPRLGPAA
jgi:putative hemin transport protein